MRREYGRAVLLTGVALVAMTFNAHGTVITFAPGDYDNTANTVTGTNAAPSYNNKQTTGDFRDVFWWGSAYNGGTKGVGSPDFINSGKNLVSNGGTPARAVVGGAYDALNFTGVRTSGGASFLTIYDTTPGDGTATRNLFDARGGLRTSADVLFTPGNHSVSAGIVALYSEGQDGLALLAKNAGGNNPDFLQLDLVFTQNGTGTVVKSVNLGPGGAQLTGSKWYNVQMDLSVSGDTYLVNGYFYKHQDETDPNSALGNLISSLSFSGSLSAPGNVLDLTNPGEIGLMAMTTESFSDGVDTVHGGTGANPLVDNLGVSITNFDIPNTPVPEPATMILLGSGLLGLAGYTRKSKRA